MYVYIHTYIHTYIHIYMKMKELNNIFFLKSFYILKFIAFFTYSLVSIY